MIRSVNNGLGNGLTIYEANGSLSYEELSNVIEDFYSDKLTPKVILDMTEATASDMSNVSTKVKEVHWNLLRG